MHALEKRAHRRKRKSTNIFDQNLPVQNDGFRLSAAIKFVPPFDEVNMMQFLNAFEKAMSIYDFPRARSGIRSEAVPHVEQIR